MHPKAILVTGSEGNIGTYVVASLKRAYPNTHIVRVALGNGETIHGTHESIYQGDLRDQHFVKRLFDEQPIDYVMHLAARLYGVAGFNSDVYGLYSNDILCLLNVLEYAKGVKKFVYFSSSMVYESSNEPPFKEDLTDTLMPPKSSYGLTKFFGENAVKFFNKQHQVTYTIWRPFNVVSPLENHMGTGGHVFVDFYRKIFVEQQPAIEIYGNGKQVRCFTWVEDVADAVAHHLVDERTNNQIFNIGSTEAKTMLELKNILIALGKQMGTLPAHYEPEIITEKTFFGVDVQLRAPSIEKITRELDWKHTTSFEACFEKFIHHKLKTRA